MKYLVVVFLFVFICSNSYAEQEIKLDFSNLKNNQINIYRVLLRGVATNTSAFSNEKNEFSNELFISQLVREIDKDKNIIIQTNVDAEKSFINGNEVDSTTTGNMQFTQMDRFGNVLSSAVEGGGKNPMQDFQLCFPDQAVKTGFEWQKKVVIDHLGKKYPVECSYKIAGFEKIAGHECVKIESYVAYKGDPKNAMETKGVIYFNPQRSLIEKSVVSSFIKSDIEISAGGIDSSSKYSVFMTVTMEHFE